MASSGQLWQRFRSPSRDGGQSRLPIKSIGLVALWLLCLYEVYSETPALWQSPKQALFIFYQPVAHILAMLWLWTAVVWFFETYMIRYQACFAAEHLRFLLSAKALAELAAAFTTVLAISAAFFVLSCVRRSPEIAAYQPALMYLGVLAILLNPLDADNDSALGPQRWFFVRTLRRVLLPFQAVAFTDFLLADILTSLAKPLSDLGVAACHLLERRSLAASLREPDGFYNSPACGGHAAFIPVLLALPYVLRFVQCIIVWRTENNRPQLFNALKYTTALPVVVFSWVKYSVTLDRWHELWRPLWVASAVVNTSYSFYWDVERDWDIRLFHRDWRTALLKTEVRMFKHSSVYICLIVVNLALRISWTYKLSSHLRHLRWFVFAMTLLEIVRRFLWSFVRVENELRKITMRSPQATPLIPSTPRRKTSAGAEDGEATELSQLRSEV